MSQQGQVVYVLGAGCSVDYGYPLANDFVRDLKNFRIEQLVGNDCKQLRQAADETLELMERSHSPTIDRLLRIIDEDWHEPGRSLQSYDPRRPPYCRIEGDSSEISRKHEERVEAITTNAKVVTAAMWLHKEQRAHESDLRGYHELFETIFQSLNWREALADAKCSVLTFNYDRLFEMAFMRRYPQFDPSRLPLYSQEVLNSGIEFWDRHKMHFAQEKFCFLKLHGSAGFWLRRHYNQVEHIFEVPAFERESPINDALFYGDAQAQSNHQTLKCEPLIVFPHEKNDARPESGTKHLYRDYVSKVYWRQAAKIIAGATHIIVVGYSFDCNDRKSFWELLQKRQRDCRIVVWNPDAENICQNLVGSCPELDGCLEPRVKRL